MPKRDFYVSDAEIAELKRLGNGNASQGLRSALRERHTLRERVSNGILLLNLLAERFERLGDKETTKVLRDAARSLLIT